MIEMPKEIILASSSPARRTILSDLGYHVTIRPTDTDEDITEKDPCLLVTRLAKRKMRAALIQNGITTQKENHSTPFTFASKNNSFFANYLSYSLDDIIFDKAIITCDTMVVFNQTPIGKPKDEEMALSFIQSFSGKEQKVVTGFSLCIPHFGFISGCDTATLCFKDIDESTAQSYIQTGEWKGAAGGYRIQKEGGKLIRQTIGDFNTVVGLPISLISALISSNFVL